VSTVARARGIGAVAVTVLALTGCVGAAGSPRTTPSPTTSPTTEPTPSSTSGPTPTEPTGPAIATGTILLAGDVMLGRGVARRTAADPDAAVTGVRDVVRAADLAAANLESPLTTRAHSPTAGPYALEAPPSRGAVLADAGFDVLQVATNHAGDAGPHTVPDTLAALDAAHLVAAGGGQDAADAFTARVLTVHGVRIAWLAIDATGAGPHAGATSPGVAWWDADRLHAAVVQARRRADVVIVGMHGGTEYLTDADPAQTARATQLARWGVDVVWGHHPHVVQPVTTIDPDRDGRPTVVATSLGNLVFDQRDPATTRGLLLELVVGRDGVRAMRRGATTIAEGRASFARWLDPDPGADAVLLQGSWWQLTRTPREVTHRPDAATRAALATSLRPGVLIDAALGDVTGDGSPDLVAAFRRPYRSTEVNTTLPRSRLVDVQGRSAHVGVYRPADLSQVWVAGTVLEPVAVLAACDGRLAVGLTGLDDAAPQGVAVWQWGGFGFVTPAELTGAGRPACADIDADGSLDPLAVERTLS